MVVGNKETAMNKCPKIGDRVKTKPTHRYGELTGTVYAIYQTHDDKWDESTDEVTPGPLRAERDWHIGMKVDVLPPHWAYTGTDRFAPEVKELVRA
jgi:hypothetical protein